MLRLILLNVRNFLVLLAVVFVSLPAVSAISRVVTHSFFPKEDSRARLINYQNLPWAEQHFREFSELETEYLSYVAWRRKPYSGSTILIDPVERIRVTPAIAGLTSAPTYFFGGSTMWGSGATNELTIPAFYQGMTRETAVNYSESGWTAHQSLNQLIKLFTEGRKPAKVAFYDGANEILAKCRVELTFFSEQNEARVREAIAYKPTDFGYYIRPLFTAAKSVAESLWGQPKDPKFYDCDSNPAKADLVAEALVEDWVAAKLITEANGGRFFAFLQPVAYLSKSRLSHLSLEQKLGQQFQVVYPLIRAKMKDRGIGVDISAALDHDEFYFIDFCHVSPNGNEAIAREMQKVMAGG